MKTRLTSSSIPDLNKIPENIEDRVMVPIYARNNLTQYIRESRRISLPSNLLRTLQWRAAELQRPVVYPIPDQINRFVLIRPTYAIDQTPIELSATQITHTFHQWIYHH